MANRRLDPVTYRPFRVDPLLSEGLLAVPRDGGDLERRVASGFARLADEFGQRADREAARAGELAGQQAAIAGRRGTISVSGGEPAGTVSVNGQAGHVRGAQGGIRVRAGNANERAAYARDYLVRQHGFTPHAAAAVAGHGMQESGFDLSAVGDSGTAYGAFQWRGDRLANLKRFAGARGRDWQTLDTQLDFAVEELGTSERTAGQALSAATNVEEAVAAFMHFERPQGYTRENPRGGHAFGNRLAYARSLAGRQGGETYSTLPDASAVAPVSVTAVEEPVTVERGRAGAFKTTGRDTVYGRAYDVAGTRTYLETLDMAMLENQQKIFDAYGDDPAMLEKALGENLVADLKDNVLEEVAPDYQLAYEKRAFALVSKAKAARKEKEEQQNRADFLGRAGQLENEKSRALAGFDPKDPDAASGLANLQASIDAHYDSAVARGVLRPAEAERAKQGSRDDTTVAYYVKQAIGKKPEEIAAMRAELTADYADGLLPGMTGDQFDKITGGLASAEKSRKTQDAQANRSLSLRGDTLAKKVASGDPVTAEEVARFRLDAGTAPSGQEIVRQTLGRMQVSQAIRTLPIGEVERQIDKLLTVGDEKPRGEDIAFARDQIAKHRKAVETDPLGVAERFGVLPIGEALPLSGDVSPDSAEDAFSARIAAADAAAEHFGVRPKYFRPDELAGVKRLIDEDPDAALSVAAGIIGTAGARAGDVFREFGDRAPGMMQAGNVLIAGGNEAAARDLLAGYGKTPDGKSYTDMQPTKRRPVSEKIVGGALVFDQALARQLEAGAASIARKRLYDAGIDPKSDEAKDIYGQALSEAAGATFVRGVQYGGFSTFDPGFRWRARQVVVPTTVRADRFEDVVGALKDADLGGVSGKNGKAWRAADFQKAMPVRVAGGHVFALGDPSGANPMFIAGADGKPIVLDFDGALGGKLKARVPEAFR